MLPQLRLSNPAQFAAFQPPDEEYALELVDKEVGGVDLGDVSRGLQFQVWTLNVTAGFVFLRSESGKEYSLFPADNITSLSLAFDQLMRPHVAYVQSGIAKFRWYDAGEEPSILEIPDARSPACCLDCKYYTFGDADDVVFAYCKGIYLYVRLQSERYLIEHQLWDVSSAGHIVRMGQNMNWRLQFEISTR